MIKSSFVRSEGAFPHFQRSSLISAATTSKPVSRVNIPKADSSEKNQTDSSHHRLIPVLHSIPLC